MRIIIEIAKEYRFWQVNKKLLNEITANIAYRFANLSKVKELEISLLLTNNARMQSLNADLRNISKATNVLSMPDIELNWRVMLEYQFDIDYTFLGDIAFGYEKILEEALMRKINFSDHFMHLYVHGILHTLGFDHQNDDEADVMEALEVAILKDFGIKSPYIINI